MENFWVKKQLIVISYRFTDITISCFILSFNDVSAAQIFNRDTKSGFVNGSKRGFFCRTFLLQILELHHFHAGFFEQFQAEFVRVTVFEHYPAYPGVNDHLGADGARLVSAIERSPLH